jgi:hypothetical protein
MEKKVHPTEIPHYEGRMSELIDLIVGELRYDKAVEFHAMLAKRYFEESKRERERGRTVLAWQLEKMGIAEHQATETMLRVWKICEPYTK